MPHYYFHLRDGAAGVLDKEGTELPSGAAAEAHALQVSRELMSRAESKRRHWQLEVRDAGGCVLFQVPFAAVDRTIDHLDIETRNTVERLCRARRELAETVFKATVQGRAIWARTNGKPYLVTHRFGQEVVAPSRPTGGRARDFARCAR